MNDYKDNQIMSREPVEQPTEIGARKAFQPKMGTVINAPFVKIRKWAKPDAPTVTNKQKGERVKLLGIEGNYYKILAFGETEGYILKEYIQED